MVLIIPALIGAAGVIGGSIGAGAIGSSSAANLNAQNREFAASEARTNRAFQHGEANRQRTWQETMSNSAYQRATRDMKSAGINPMLAYMQGGSSTPSGGQASGAQASTPGTETPGKYMAQSIQTMAQSAVDAANKMIDSKVKMGEAELKGVQKGLVTAQTMNVGASTAKTMQEKRVVMVEAAVKEHLAGKKIDAETSRFEWEKIVNDIQKENPHVYMNKKEIMDIVKTLLYSGSIVTGLMKGRGGKNSPKIHAPNRKESMIINQSINK